MSESAGRVVVAGITTRALAGSAARAGWEVTAVDAFGDLDLRLHASVIPLRREDGGFQAGAAAEVAHGVPADAAAYTSNLENYPRAVARLAQGRRLLGNSPAVLRRVRDPLQLMRALRRHGFETPATRAAPPRAAAGPREWLLKPRRSGGGHGTSAWRRGLPVGRHQYLQERVAGVPGSIVFVANGDGVVPLALSRQLVGDRAFGAAGFRYCGSLVGRTLFAEEERLLARAAALALTVTREFGLVGLNGIDFIARRGTPWPTEVNPRYAASMELVERVCGVSLFAIHVESCRGRLPAVPVRCAAGVWGKAVVFARRDVILGDTRRWLEDPAIADVPHPGERVPRGRPICTVFASGPRVEACRRALAGKAAAIYRVAAAAAKGVA